MPVSNIFEPDTPQPKSPGGNVLRRLLKPQVVLPVLSVLLIVSVLVGIPLVMHASKMRGIPDVAEPFDLKSHGIVTIKPGDNAIDAYRQGMNLLSRPKSSEPIELHEKLGVALEGTWADADPQVRQWLEDNRPMLEQFLRGSELPEALEVQPQDQRLSSLYPVTSRIREVARFVQLEGLRLESEGDFVGAWKWYRAILRSSRHAGRHGGVIERLTGISLHAIGADAAARWAEHPQIDSQLMKAALKDVQELRGSTTPTTTTLKSAYFDFLSAPKEAESGEESAFQVRCAFYLIGEPELSHRIGKLAWVNWMSQIDRPRFQRIPCGQHGLFLLDPAQPRSPNLYSGDDIAPWLERSVLVVLQVQSYEMFFAAVDRESAKQGLLELTLALQLYSREQGGEYPESLEVLRPKYLTAIPADPFGKGESLRYRRESVPKPGFTIWSIGPDEVDDDGKIEFGTPSYSKNGDIVIRAPRPKPPKAELTKELPSK